MEYLDKWNGKPTKFQKMVLVGEFNNICKKTEVRCLRNNIYHTVRVQNYNHLIELRQSHPMVAPMENTEQMLHTLIKLIWGKRDLSNGYHSTYEGMFWLSFGLSKEQLEKKLKN